MNRCKIKYYVIVYAATQYYDLSNGFADAPPEMIPEYLETQMGDYNDNCDHDLKANTGKTYLVKDPGRRNGIGGRYHAAEEYTGPYIHRKTEDKGYICLELKYLLVKDTYNNNVTDYAL